MLAWEEAQIAAHRCSKCQRFGHLEGSIECDQLAEARPVLWQKLHVFSPVPPKPSPAPSHLVTAAIAILLMGLVLALMISRAC